MMGTSCSTPPHFHYHPPTHSPLPTTNNQPPTNHLHQYQSTTNPSPQERCFRFIGTRATLVLQSEAALEVPESVMAELVKREDLCAPEISIFEVVQRWSMARDGDPMAAATGDLGGGGGGSFDKGGGGGGAAQTTTPPTPPPPPPLPPLSSERNRREAAMEITKHLRLPLISLRDLMKLVSK
jgi:hypothetical protein